MSPDIRDRWNECMVAIHDLMGQMTATEYVEACAKLQEFGRSSQPQPPPKPSARLTPEELRLGLQTQCRVTAGCWLPAGHLGHCD